jgi:agrin
MNRNFRYVEFRYDLGSGIAVIKSHLPITAGQWHRVQARRWHRDGMLRLDNGEDVSGQSGGDLRALDIDRESMYIGGIPIENDEKSQKNISRIAQNLGLRKVVGNYVYIFFKIMAIS